MAYGTGKLATYLALPFAWALDLPSVMGWYGLLWLSFDKRLWRKQLPYIKRSVSDIPDLHGTWVGSLKSEYVPTGATQPVPVNIPIFLLILQTWTEIRVKAYTSKSVSCSTMAALHTSDAHDAGLKYEYFNEPRALEVDSMQTHRGTGHLEHTSKDTLKGSYYNGRGRRTIGTLELRRTSATILDPDTALPPPTTP